MDPILEAKYLKELCDGNDQAYDKLFLFYYPKVRNFLVGFVKDEEQASDMAQDLFFKVWIFRTDLPKIHSFKAYLFQSARNMVYDYFDHNIIREKYTASVYKEGRNVYEDFPEEEIYAKELSILIDLLIEKMPNQRKRIFIMSRKQGLSNEQIANDLQISKRTVENHITQALNDLRKFMKYMISCFF